MEFFVGKGDGGLAVKMEGFSGGAWDLSGFAVGDEFGLGDLVEGVMGGEFVLDEGMG